MNEKVKITKSTTHSHTTLAVFSLTIGVLSIPTSFVLFGFILGMIGVVFGVWHFRKYTEAKLMAGLGICFSIIGIMASGVMLWLYVWAFYSMQDTYNTSQQGFGQWIGSPAPDIEFKDIDGDTFTLASLQGKKVILDFWGTWCPPCKKQLPHFNQIQKEYPKEVVVIGISKEDIDIQKKFAADYGVSFTLAVLENPIEPYGHVVSLPTTFFIDEKGIIQHTAVGYHTYKEIKHYTFLTLDEETPDSESP